MIPKFPEFKKLELSDKDEINDFVKKHPPYSDYNFVSLWSYNTKETVSISKLNDNLVIQFEDYLTNHPFYSFLGTNKTKETIDILLKHEQNLSSRLKLIPEVVVKSLENDCHNFAIEEDQNNFDYIISINEIAHMKSKKHYNKKKQLNIFQREYPHCKIFPLDLKSEDIQRKIINVFHLWKKSKNKTKEEVSIELIAIQRALKDSHHLQLEGIGIYNQDKIIGFAITDNGHNQCASFHFIKADVSYKGIYSVLYIYMAKHLMEKGLLTMNIEQDLGIEGLRKAKKQWHPVGYLKKYTISQK